MNKLCINAKNYQLTEGQEYEILQEEDGYVRIINDSGKNVRYDSSLFQEEEIIPEEIILERTEQDCIDSITYVNHLLGYVDIDGNLKTTQISLELKANDGFSCGIVRIEGVNNLCVKLETQSFIDTENDDFIELKKALFKTLFGYWIGHSGTRGMWMCSTNQNDSYEDYQTFLDTFSNHNSGWFLNPGSGNQIKLWYGIINQ